jgi:CubicO group peptidase (beta-lactamase class C family)
MSGFAAAARILDDAVRAGAFPAAVAEAGTGSECRWRHAVGRLSCEPDSPLATPETIFDLASLTKVIATTTLAMCHVDAGLMSLDLPISEALRAWRGGDREMVTVRDLLEHASGLTAHLPFYRDHVRRAEFEPAICQLPLEYAPRSRSVYSDLGFMLLGFMLADRDAGTPLPSQFDAIAARRGWGDLRFHPPAEWRPRTAPTECDPWRGRILVGEVHDENAWALGGAAGHAGLFGDAGAVGRFARDVLAGLRGGGPLASRATFDLFRRRTTVPGSSRALGWDTMLPTSSCGSRLSRESIGHTGFTGTSLWIDPAADRYFVLLTNRVHPSRSNDAILAVRPAFHDALVTAGER